MAFDFKNLLLQGGAAALGAPGIGKLLGVAEDYMPLLGIGSGVLQGLGDAFGLSSGGGGTTPLDMARQAQEAASFTSTGAEGAAANRESAEAARRFIGQQTAEGRLAAQQQRALGSQALGAAQQTTDLARSAAMMNLGNQRRDLMQQGAAAGASSAALADIAGNVGQSNIQVMNALAQQGADAQQRAFQTAGQAFGAAEQIRGADLTQQSKNFEPFSLQKFGGTNLGQIAGYQQAGQQMRAEEDPLALLKMLGGKGATWAYNRPYEQETIAQKEQKTT